MAVKAMIKTAEYHDSVSLMLAARELSGLRGVGDAAVVMGTQANQSILADAGLLTEDAQKAGPNDLIIAVKAGTMTEAQAALEKAESLLKKKAASDVMGEYTPKTIRGAVASHPEANIAVISVAGRYAADEAWEALSRGLHVLLFSDNVSLEDEIALKEYARDHGLLMMGSGAGTAIINHVALGFANVIPSGPVGIVSAAGTGLQEVSTLLARQGIGITQAIGTGGRDLSRGVGGIMMLEGLKALQQDPDTQVITLVSKPPANEVVKAILQQVSSCDKPTVICFLGGSQTGLGKLPNVSFTHTLQECALQTARIVRPELDDLKTFLEKEHLQIMEQASGLKKRLNAGQRYLRGLFSGGTLCYESQVIWKDQLNSPVYSNAPLPDGVSLVDPIKSREHTAIDLGEEEFTVGRPHPMIDNDLRMRRIMQEARDPQTAVILLDVVLGYGAHPDPAAELGRAALEAQELAKKQGRDLLVVASVTGTESDPQCLSRTSATLSRSGVTVCPSNAAAARLAGLIVSI
jgi:FdrA protein